MSLCTLYYGDTPWEQAYNGAVDRLFGNSLQWNPIIDERLPRLIVTLCTGASLAVSGAVMQSLFHNPLASPSVLGISCGGSLLVTIVYVMEWYFIYPYAIPIAAILGCLTTLILVYGLSQSRGEMQLNKLILTGIAISTLLVACQGMIMYALRDHWHLIQVLTEWESGSTIDRSWRHVHMQLPLTLVGLTGCWMYRNEMDILAMGCEEAKNLGVDVDKARWTLFVCVALLTGGALAAVGIIAFFGLVLPHLFRSIFGPRNEVLIPLCIFGGAITFCSMDLCLRIFNIHSFSIGNISAIIGGAFFMALLVFPNKKLNSVEA
ncbi:MAG: iron ABC transporter permease [Chlamydiota bacterium]|nr:iron ABC transporter permease [Chlamydiota bacterium]